MPNFDMSIPGARWVETEHEARGWIERYLYTHRINNGLGLDTETTGRDKMRDSVIIWSISDGDTRLCLDRKFLGLFKEPLLENPNINFDLTNAKFDAHMLANSGIDLTKAGEWRCTLPQSWLFNENNLGRHGLKECVTDHFGRLTPSFEKVFGINGKIPPKKIDKKTGLQVSKTIEELIQDALKDPQRFVEAVDYSSLDSYNSTKLRAFFDDKLAGISTLGSGNLRDYYYAVEVPFTKVLFKMERRGFTVDAGYLREQATPMKIRMEEIERMFFHAAGREINLDSTNDVRWFFFERLGKKSIKQTKGGKTGIKKDSTDEEVLETWAGQGDEWAELLLEYRGISKIEGTYVSGLQRWLDPYFRIHTSLNQIGTVTGRLSSSEPNLQNIPRPDEDAYKIREAFIPGERRALVVADYEQLEMRLMAHFSGDEKMIKAILDGLDLHCFTTSELGGIPYEEVVAAKKVKKKEDLTPAQSDLLLKRQQFKSTGFGIIYGIGGNKLARKLTRETGKVVTDDEGWDLIEHWLDVYPGVRQHIEDVKNEMARTGIVRVFTGRPRRVGDTSAMSWKDASRAERQGGNSEIQGTAAEIAKYSMILCENDKRLKDLGCEMLLQVHDELVFEVPDDSGVVGAVKERVKEIMEHPFPVDLRVPIPISIGHGYSWASAK